MANKREGAVEAAFSRLALVLAEIAYNAPAPGNRPENLRDKDPLSPEMEKNRSHQSQQNRRSGQDCCPKKRV
jgi:hypothetical protein